MNVDLLGDEALVDLEEFADELDQGITIKRGERNACGRLVQTCHVLFRPEQSDATVLILVCLHSLKALECVVEHARGGIQTKVLVGRDACWKPPFRCSPFEREHVV